MYGRIWCALALECVENVKRQRVIDIISGSTTTFDTDHFTDFYMRQPPNQLVSARDV